MVLHSKRRSATVKIHRMGEDCLITEPAGSTNTDGYGKTATDDTFDPIEWEKVVRVYGGGATDPSADRHAGGRLPADSPLLLFVHDSVVQEGFRVTYGSNIYEIDSLSRYPSHIEARTTLVN